MTLIPRTVLGRALACCLLTTVAWAQAPVVNDAENFALNGDDLNQPLAKDNTESGHNDDASLMNQIQGLQQDIQELRGQLETQTHELKKLQDQQLAFYKDLDDRLNQSPTHVATSKKIDVPVTPEPINSANTTATTRQTHSSDEQLSYLAAFELIKKHQYDEALTNMKTFTTQYPQSIFSANAHYWMGELYMVKKDYTTAITEFDTVIKQYPSSNKMSASLLKSGYALEALGQHGDAKSRWNQVVKNYPDTQTAQLAHKKLAST